MQQLGLQVNPGQLPQLRLAPGQLPQLRLAPGRLQQPRLAPGRLHQLRLALGRLQQLRLAPGRLQQRRLASGRLHQLRLEPGRLLHLPLAPQHLWLESGQLQQGTRQSVDSRYLGATRFEQSGALRRAEGSHVRAQRRTGRGWPLQRHPSTDHAQESVRSLTRGAPEADSGHKRNESRSQGGLYGGSVQLGSL